MKNKSFFNLLSFIALISIVVVINVYFAAAAFALSLCDGCPLQEICADTTAGVEVLSCDNNAVAGAPALMGNAAQLINEEAAVETQETAITPDLAVTKEIVITPDALTGEVTIGEVATGEVAAVISAQQAPPLNEFAGLNAYQTTGEAFLIITLKGDSALLEKLSRIITDKYSIKDGKGEGCDLIMATAEEFTIKISKETETDKLDFIKSQGIEFSK